MANYTKNTPVQEHRLRAQAFKELQRFSLTKTMSVKIPDAKKYKAPNQKAKDRLSSGYLKFLNHNEIEKCLVQ
jgi:hypothetical protein